MPPGAVEVPNNFRAAFLIGQQLAIRVAETPTPNRIPSGVFEYRTGHGYSRMTNPLFKIGAWGGEPKRCSRWF